MFHETRADMKEIHTCPTKYCWQDVKVAGARLDLHLSSTRDGFVLNLRREIPVTLAENIEL